MLLAKKCHVRASRSHAAASCTTVAVPRQHVVSRRQLVAVASSAAAAAPASAPTEAITLTDRALSHLVKLRQERAASSDGKDQQLVFRVGVKQGGCSGMSYVMDFEQPDNIKEDDYVMEYESGAFKLACDSKSLLYLFGMRLDYSDALIGGGFQFNNPNAADSCGCGKSFGV